MKNGQERNSIIVQGSKGWYAAVFEAEVLAIQVCAKTILDERIYGKLITICSDSQAAIARVG